MIDKRCGIEAKDLIKMMGATWCKAAVTAGRAYLHRTKTTFTREEVFMISGLEAHHIAVEGLDRALKDHATKDKKLKDLTVGDLDELIRELRLMACRPIDLSEQALEALA